MIDRVWVDLTSYKGFGVLGAPISRQFLTTEICYPVLIKIASKLTWVYEFKGSLFSTVAFCVYFLYEAVF